DGLKSAHTDLGTHEESRFDNISKKIKLEDLSDLMKDTRSAFFTLDAPTNEPIIVTDKSEEEEAEKHKEAHAASHNKPVDTSASHPPFPKSVQLQELKDQLLVTSLKPELSNLLASHDFASSIPSELKELPSKITTLSGEIQELRRHVQGMEIELPDFKWELPAEFLALPSQILSIYAKLQTLDTLTSLLNKVSNTLTRFSSIMENASHTAKSKGVSLVGPTTASPAEEEKNTNPTIKDAETTNLHDELVGLLGIDIVTQIHIPITLQLYREDGINKVIPNVKVSGLHLAEWKEDVQACPDRKEKGWKTIYRLIKTRMKYLNQTEKELKFDFNKPFKEQDPLNELNDLAKKKRKRTGDLKDHFGLTKKHKSSIQHEEEEEIVRFSSCALRSLSRLRSKGSLVSALQILRRLRSIFTSVYAADQKLKKAYVKSFNSAWLTIPS
ncbi:hypothetical protein Tco_1481692, partial [Tanacetum coccineum]